MVCRASTDRSRWMGKRVSPDVCCDRCLGRYCSNAVVRSSPTLFVPVVMMCSFEPSCQTAHVGMRISIAWIHPLHHVDTLALPPTPTSSFRFVRMGFAYANEHIIQYMNNVKAPYNVNRLTQEVAVRALKDRSLYEDRVTTILDVSRVRFLEARRELNPFACRLMHMEDAAVLL